MSQSTCPLCAAPTPAPVLQEGVGSRIKCTRCGTYVISERVVQRLYELSHVPTAEPTQNWRWSGAIRERNARGIEPVVRSLEELNAMVPRRDLLRSIDALVAYIRRKAPSFNGRVHLKPAYDYPLVSANGPEEFESVVGRAAELGYLKSVKGELGGRDVILTTEGWRRATEIEADLGRSSQAFVAMWFSAETSTAYTEGIAPALRATGYDPFRVDEPEHNGKIDDLIVAEVRRSGLLVADFTGHRGGVYFEAGLAMGLGIPVVWTCRADYISGEKGEPHFDTRQYNHIVWETPADLRTRLENRVRATVPKAR